MRPEDPIWLGLEVLLHLQVIERVRCPTIKGGRMVAVMACPQGRSQEVVMLLIHIF